MQLEQTLCSITLTYCVVKGELKKESKQIKSEDSSANVFFFFFLRMELKSRIKKDLIPSGRSSRNVQSLLFFCWASGRDTKPSASVLKVLYVKVCF